MLPATNYSRNYASIIGNGQLIQGVGACRHFEVNTTSCLRGALPISKVNIFMNVLLVINIFRPSCVVCEHNLL